MDLDANVIDAVVFDIGGVFLVPHPDPIGDALAEVGIHVERDPERFRAAHYHGARGLTDLMLADDHVDELRHDSWRSYDLRYFGHLGVDDDLIEDAHRARAAQRHVGAAEVWRLPLPHNIEAFHRLAAAGCRLGIVSNNDGTAADQMLTHRVCQLGVGQLPEVVAIVDSAVVGASKPDPRIFDPVLEALAVSPERVLYVGDTVHADVAGAAAAGLQVVQLDPLDLHADFDHHRAPDVAAVVDWLAR